ncbi:hypothetical protein M408DRAFT_23870 [Serendipita vermifera MAFF 305830]|uniref:C2H2-type domain-containing protein n=1 Tax=Serendipita vermifera MAFF 305830 TaxID=933852 RepID=A0A0C2WPM9_SERVB|nr:hypothetical protein M408DRAFT_23870 [Serendipita vermifera MAFF 305830]
MDVSQNNEKGLRIVSFDGGGPGSMSQLGIIQDIMRRVAYDLDVDEQELRPADYWDLMGGVGFGGFCALLLGRLRMSVEQAMEELATIGTTLFPGNPNEMATPEANTTIMVEAMKDMLRRHKLAPDIKLNDKALRGSSCKVIVFAATMSTTSDCHPFRTYRSRYGTSNCTFVEAACATLATLGLFSPIVIGPPLRKQKFVGTPLGFNNPMRQVLNEARMQFGEENMASLLLSVGSGRPARLSLDVRPPNPYNYRDFLACVTLDCERVARELEDQLLGVESYVRLNVNQGMDNPNVSDWHELGEIEAHTAVYLQLPTVIQSVDLSARMIQERVKSVSLGQLTRTSTFFIAKFNPQQCTNHLALSPMAIKQIRDTIREGVQGITLVDAIGNHIPIPLHLCRSYLMLSKIILAYFQDQKPPGSSLVKRGDYLLISGNKGSFIDPSVWPYLRQSGLIVEMSMIRDGGLNGMRCPCGSDVVITPASPTAWEITVEVEEDWKQFRLITVATSPALPAAARPRPKGYPTEAQLKDPSYINRPYACKSCPARFERTDLLQRHVKGLHHQENLGEPLSGVALYKVVISITTAERTATDTLR